MSRRRGDRAQIVPRGRRALAAGFVFALAAGFTGALDPPAIELAPDTAHIGDPLTLRLTIPGVSAPDSVSWPEIGETLGDFHVLGADTITGRRARKAGGASLVLTVAAYDTGSVSTGALDFTVGGQPWTLPGDSVHIASVLPDTGEVDLRPLKAQEELRWTVLDWLKYYGPWVGGAILLALLIWLARRWWLSRKRRAGEAEEEIPEIPPYEQARDALDALTRDNPLARGDLRGYVSALVFICKRLLERTNGEPVLEMTTAEVRRWARGNELPFAARDLIRMLDASDTVKFARGALDAHTAEDLLAIAARIVEAHRPEPESEEAADAAGEGAAGTAGDGRTAGERENPRGGSPGTPTQESVEAGERASWSTRTGQRGDG